MNKCIRHGEAVGVCSEVVSRCQRKQNVVASRPNSKCLTTDKFFWRFCCSSIAVAIVTSTLLVPSNVVAADLTPVYQIVAPGFPVTYPQTAGTYQDGPHVGPSVGNLDEDEQLEILLSSVANGPILAFKSNGMQVNGWPTDSEPFGFAYFALADVSTSTPGAEIFAGHFSLDSQLVLLGRGGESITGWPIAAANFSAFSPAAYDLDNDGVPELFIEEEDGRLHGYEASGQMLPGWPVGDRSTACDEQRTFTPTFVDIDRDGRLDVLFANGGGAGASRQGPCIDAYNLQGIQLPGFPVVLPGIGFFATFFNVADVDGDSTDDIVTIQGDANGDTMGPATVQILGLNGKPKHSIPLEPFGDFIFGATTALGDLDGDGIAEIVAVTEGTATALNGNGEILSGWPAYFYANIPNNGTGVDLSGCGTAIGDVDGDLQPDIVFCASFGAAGAYLFVLNRFGVPLADSPYLLETFARARGPVIADVDADGRNEIVVATEGSFGANLWLLKLDNSRPHGAVEWQKFGADAANTGRYAPSFPAVASSVDLSLTTNGNVQSVVGDIETLELVVKNNGAGTTNAVLSVSLPAQMIGRGDMPVGCTAFGPNLVCPVNDMVSGEGRSLSIPICTDTAGSFQVSATLRGSGPENDYSNNRAVVNVDAVGFAGTNCPTYQVPVPAPSAQLSGPEKAFTNSEHEFSWRAFNVTTCSIVSPFHTDVASLDFARFGVGDVPMVRRYQLDCSGPYGAVSSAIDVEVVEPQLSFRSNKTSGTIGSTITLTWDSQDFDMCEASGAWSGTLPTSGNAQVTINMLGDNLYSIKCTGPIGSFSRSIIVRGIQSGSSGGSNPPNNGGSGNSGGGGGVNNWFLLILGLAAGLRLVRQACCHEIDGSG